MIARGREAVVCGLAELADLHIVLKKDGISLSLVITYFAYNLHEVAEGVLRMGWPSVETDYDAFISQLFYLISADVESVVLVVSRHELIYLEIFGLFTLLPHGTVLRGVH